MNSLTPWGEGGGRGERGEGGFISAGAPQDRFPPKWTVARDLPHEATQDSFPSKWTVARNLPHVATQGRFSPSYFAPEDLKNRMNSSFSSYHPGAKYSWRGKELNKFCPPTAAMTFALSSLYILHLWP